MIKDQQMTQSLFYPGCWRRIHTIGTQAWLGSCQPATRWILKELKKTFIQQTILESQLISYRKRPISTGNLIQAFAWLFSRHPSDTMRSKMWLRKKRNLCLLLYVSHAWIANRFYSVMHRKLNLGIKNIQKKLGVPSLWS